MIASEERSALCSLRRRTLVGKNRNWYVNPQAGGAMTTDCHSTPAAAAAAMAARLKTMMHGSFRADISKTQLRIWSDNQTIFPELG
jgi:hypothetical protein